MYRVHRLFIYLKRFHVNISIIYFNILYMSVDK